METKDIFKNLNKEQKEAVTHGEGPLLIVAGAGTGKTTVITQRIAWLILEKKIKAEEVLALTFTDKAAGEMEERVENTLPMGYVDLWISTFHSFCERILKQHALDIGLPNDFKLLNQTEQWLLIRQNLDKFDLEYYRPLGNPTKFIAALVKHFSRAKDEEISPADYLAYAEKLKINLDGMEGTGGKVIKTQERKNARTKKTKPTSAPQSGATVDDESLLEIKRVNEIANAYHVYQQLLLENNALDFGDLINYALKLFRTRPQILAEYRKRFKYILVDEFQDTNWAQYELVKLLASPKNNLTTVGDDDQSIYKFRGASVSNILQFKKDYPKAEEVVLTSNYRSMQNILDLSYRFIRQNDPNRLEVKLGIDKKMIGKNKGKGAIEHLHSETAEEEVGSIVDKILMFKKTDKDILWSDFAILVRANDAANPIVNALNRAGVPNQFLSLRGLYGKPIILDMINYFKLLDNYHESSAVYRLLTSPVFSLDHHDLSTLVYAGFKNSNSLFEVLGQAATIRGLKEETLSKINKFVGLVTSHAQLAREKTPSELLISFMADSGYNEYVKNLPEGDGREQFNFLQQFLEKMKKFEAAEVEPRLRGFMAALAMELEAGDEGSLKIDFEEGPDVVKIMTVHGAKGLEFKYIFLANLVDKRFPTIERKDPIEIPDALVKEILPEGDIHMEEERRLFYVGMTRAKEGLFFTSAEDYGGARDKKLSRFLIELGYEQSEKRKTQSVKEFPKKPEPMPITYKKQNGYYLPAKFSYSQLAAFAKCPLQYKFSFILRVPTRGKSVFSFGKTMHGTLQRFLTGCLEKNNHQQNDLFGQTAKDPDTNLKPKCVLSLDELLKIYDECWQDEWYPDKLTKEKYKKQGRESLIQFHKEFFAAPPHVMALEEDFNCRLKNYWLKGRIDRVDWLDAKKGEVEIIDYKTGSAKEEKNLSLDDKEQLLIYQIAAEEVYNLKPKKLTFYYLDNNKKISFLGDDKEKEKLKEKIVAEIKQIKDSDFKATPGWQCDFCDFKDICEFRAS